MGNKRGSEWETEKEMGTDEALEGRDLMRIYAIMRKIFLISAVFSGIQDRK